MNYKHLGRSVLALAVASTAGVSQAQQLEEVIVTAQKREQDVLEVPISMATMSGEKFKAIFEGGADIRGLSARVPGLYVESSNGRIAPRFYIRGLGNIDFDLAASQPVSVIFDEVVKENVVLKGFPIFDIAQVEVLRGPQGSLFGRNTIAGIVKLDSNKPSQEFEASVKLDVGELGTLNFEGAIGGAISENLSARLAVLSQHRDDWISKGSNSNQAWVDSGLPIQEDVLGEFEENAFKAWLLYEGDNTDVLFGLHSRDYDGTSSLFRANVLTTGSNDLNENYIRDVVFYDEGVDEDGNHNPQSYESTGFNLKITHDIGNMTFTSITAYDESEGISLGDIDGGFGASFLPFMGPGFIPFPSMTSGQADTNQFTQEFRLSSDSDANLKWQVGYFYFESKLDATTNPFFIPATTTTTDNDAFAIFGQTDVNVGDDIIVTLGVRYTGDNKDFKSPVPEHATSLSDDQLSGNVSVTYLADDNTTFWGKIASGFRAPTIQGRDVAFGGAPSTADSETIISYELGYKAEFWNNRARLNSAIFFYEVEDMQITAVGGDGNNIALNNVENATGIGYEFDVQVVITENFEISLGYSYADTEFDDPNLETSICGSGQCTVTDSTRVTEAGDTVANINGNPFPNAPESTLSFTASFSLPIGDNAELFAFTDWAFQGDTNIFLYESVEYQTKDQFEGGVRFGWRRLDGSLEFAVFGRNITDEENIQGGIDFNNLTAFTNEPEIWGVSAAAAF